MVTIQAKVEPLEFLQLNDVASVLNAYTTLHGMGYRGGLDTAGDEARIAMSQPDQVSVAVGVGDVILYRTNPAVQVVDCLTWDELLAHYEEVPGV